MFWVYGSGSLSLEKEAKKSRGLSNAHGLKIVKNAINPRAWIFPQT